MTRKPTAKTYFAPFYRGKITTHEMLDGYTYPALYETEEAAKIYGYKDVRRVKITEVRGRG